MRLQLSTFGLALIALSCAAGAQTTDPTIPPITLPEMRFSGFGTIGIVSTNTDDAIFQTGIQADGATKTKPSATPDTRLGLQADAKFNDTFSATGQLLMRQNVRDNYDPKVEWAFLKGKINSNFSVRAGRMGAPFFMTSDFRTVGYTNVSARNPIEAYGINNIRNFDGADVLYQGSFGDTTINAQVYGGEGRVLNSYPNGQELYFLTKDMLGFNASAEMGAFTLRVGAVQTNLGTDGDGIVGFNTLLTTLNALSATPGNAALSSVADAISVNGKKASFSGLGLVYDNGPWVVNAEVVQRKTDSLYVSDATAWYTTAGYRIEKFTPYISYAKRTQTSATSIAMPATPQGTALGAKINGPVLTDNSVSSLAIGTRWDLGKSFALKGELAQITIPANSNASNYFIPPTSFTTDTTRVRQLMT